MERSFQSCMMIHSPNVVFVLGEVHCVCQLRSKKFQAAQTPVEGFAVQRLGHSFSENWRAGVESLIVRNFFLKTVAFQATCLMKANGVATWSFTSMCSASNECSVTPTIQILRLSLGTTTLAFTTCEQERLPWVVWLFAFGWKEIWVISSEHIPT